MKFEFFFILGTLGSFRVKQDVSLNRTWIKYNKFSSVLTGLNVNLNEAVFKGRISHSSGETENIPFVSVTHYKMRYKKEYML